MEAYLQYSICVVVTALAIVGVKAIAVYLRYRERKFNPDAFKKVADLPEGVFRQMKNARVAVYLKNGETVGDCRYRKTLFFNEGEFAINTTVFFELERDDGTLCFVSGTDVSRIEARKGY